MCSLAEPSRSAADAESGRLRASMIPAIVLPGIGRQPRCDAPRIDAYASASLKAEATGLQPADPAKFLLGSPKLWNSGGPPFPLMAR